MTNRNPHLPWRRGACFIALALCVASCGSGSDADTEASAAEQTTVTTAAALPDSGLPSLEEIDQNPAADDSDSMVDQDAEDEADQEPPTEEAAVESYLDCMRDAGIDVEEIEEAPFEDQQALTSSPEFLAANAECEAILEAAFGDFELDPELEAQLRDRSAEMAACGREVLGVDIPDDVLLLEPDDPRMLELDALETTPEQDAELEVCAEEILGDLLDDDGNLIAPEDSE